MGGASAPPLCFLLLLNKKTFYKMGHFDKLHATKVAAQTVDAQQLDAEYVLRDAVPSAIAAGAHTVTIAEIRNGVLRSDPEADVAFTAPTAALAVAGCDGCAVGDSIDFSIINTGTAGADEIITLAAGSGGTLIGSGAVLTADPVNDAFSSGSGLFRLQFTNVTASSEAYDLIRLA